MITITIHSDESLADPHFDVLHRACREVAENTGQLVHVKAEFTIAPALIDPRPTEAQIQKAIDCIQEHGRRHPATPNVVEPHKWPDLDDSNSSNGSDDPFAVDWSKAPLCAKWHAFDSDGVGCWYKDEPHIDDDQFCGGIDGNAYIEISHQISLDNIDWKCSLRKRPPVPCTITTSSLIKDQAS